MGFVGRKLLSSNISYGTFEINHGKNATNQFLRVMYIPFEVRCEHGTYNNIMLWSSTQSS